jgi:hypothetical protein
MHHWLGPETLPRQRSLELAVTDCCLLVWCTSPWSGEAEFVVFRGRGRGRVRALGLGEAELPMAPEAGLGCCQPHSVEWHNSQSGAGGVVLSSGRSVERRSDCGHFGSVDWRARVRIRCQATLALNASAVRSVWRSGQGCFLAKTGPRASRRCVRCLRGPLGETWTLRGRLSLPEARLGRGEIVSLEWTEPWLNRTHQAFAALCWWGLPAEIRSLGVTPNYGPRHNPFQFLQVFSLGLVSSLVS